jgi:Ca2+-transporting ATPase
MGITGTEVSKDASAMILSDDNFATIIKAVANGRNVYRNIKNAILFLLSGNMAGILSVLYTSLMGLPIPFAPVHLLFMNLITDSLPAIAIGTEQSRDDVLREKPRSANDSILNKKTIFGIGLEGILIAICTLAAYAVGYGINAATASTMAFATICLARLFHGMGSRSDRPLTAIGFLTNKFSVVALLIGVALLHAVLLIPALHSLFSVVTLSSLNLLIVYGFSLLPTIILQIKKRITDRV